MAAPNATSFETTHRVLFEPATAIAALPEKSIALVVTSPPYPMIEMWDETFAAQDAAVRAALDEHDGRSAFERMHQVLDRIWEEIPRVLIDGGILCVNVGDATRTLGGEFALYPNHARIAHAVGQLGLTALPTILWRKQTNAPNKFMGSGMLPPGAYVTLEHEHVLIFRKGGKRSFPSPRDAAARRASAYFWEERNQWFSDVWFDLKGSRQELLDGPTRKRSGAYPFELPYRLISMFSVKEDTVLDPFLGLGTTTLAALAAARNSIGYELDRSLCPVLTERVKQTVVLARARIESRLTHHLEFVRERSEARGPLKHRNKHYDFPVVTKQEESLVLDTLTDVAANSETDGEVAFGGRHTSTPQEPHTGKQEELAPARQGSSATRRAAAQDAPGGVQPDLFEPHEGDPTR